ncbi:hypothetical protein LQ318_01585 [Aliifodinibius salicampi]|uniref:Copper resistance protein D n=1 Tax=Fodinibius salicampi TaxID=1920655 RepID=A0ABT3PUP8_9BACT|nr:hypothetical protein [Fodinibius salicampi]MCW9711582.1 hypothetical protein [Fodinibius salicampi]
MSYQTFYSLHIYSYVIWLLAFAGSLLLASKVREETDVHRKRQYIRYERLITNIGAHLAALGILISGGGMVSLEEGPRWGWFDFQEHTWLAVKQLFFVLILVCIGFSIKRSRALKREIRNFDQVMNDRISQKWSSAYRMSLLVYMLVLMNTFLGFVKPF